MNGPFTRIPEAIILRYFFSSVVQMYAYVIEFTFHIICDIVVNTANYGFHAFQVFKIDVISAPDKSLS